jgi:multiple sugar transport system substrate-binding protein
MSRLTPLRAAIAGGVAASLALLAGCGSGSAAPAPTAPTTPATATIQFLGPEDPATFKPLISKFESSHPGLTVNYTQVPFDQLNSTLDQRLGARDATIDVYTVDQPRVAQLAAKGYLEDLTDLSDRAKAATTPTQYEVNVFRDKLWALPIWNSTQLMFVNNDALTSAGVQAPTQDPAKRWTWEQTVAAAKTVQANGGVKWGLIPEQTEYYYQLQPLPESIGGGSGITGADMLTPDITNDAWVRSMTWYRSLFTDGLAPRGVGSFETSPLFDNGQTAFFIGGPWDIGTFAKSKVDWSVVPMPYFEGGKPVTPTGSWSWGINPASPNKGAARAFIEFAALDTAGNLASTEASTIIPANTAAEKQYLPRLDALAGEKSAGASTLISYETANTAVARPVSVGYVQFEEIMNRAFGDIRNGSDPKGRLEQATQQLNDAWAQLQ